MFIAAMIGGVLALGASVFSAIQCIIHGGKKKMINVKFDYPTRQKMPAQFEQTFKKAIELGVAPPRSQVELITRGTNPYGRTTPFSYRIHVPTGQVISGTITRSELSALICKLEKKGVKFDALH